MSSIGGAGAHSPTVRTVSRVAMLDVAALLDLCASRMSPRPDGLVDTGEILATEVLEALGVDCSPGSQFFDRHFRKDG